MQEKPVCAQKNICVRPSGRKVVVSLVFEAKMTENRRILVDDDLGCALYRGEVLLGGFAWDCMIKRLSKKGETECGQTVVNF